ncbi:SARM1 protein, partial [Thryothorus ludovicianus]|nr:SARM1 protein [Thryothorus ludovicianus]
MLALLLSLHTLGRSLAMASAERLAVPECVSRVGGWAGGDSSREHGGVSPGVGTEVREALERVVPVLRRAIAQATQAATAEGLRAALSEVFRLVEEAWGMPAVGRDVAKVLCDVIRLEGGLDLLLNLLYTAELETKCQAGKLLEQILVAENRKHHWHSLHSALSFLARESICWSCFCSRSSLWARVLEQPWNSSPSLPTTSEGWQKGVGFPFGTRPLTYRALPVCAQQQRCLAGSWTGPGVRDLFGPCLSSSSMAESGLRARPRLRAFFFPRALHNISCQTPPKVSESPVGHRLPRNALPACQHRGWCAITPPSLGTECATALMSRRAQGTCARAASQREQLHHGTKCEIGATQSLKRIVCYSTSSTTSSLAKKVLRMIGEEGPRRILPAVPNWKSCEVQTWLQQIGFNKYCQRFLDHQVDGDILLRLTEQELQKDLGMDSSITRKRFFRELTELKTFANYSTCDRSNLADWLGGIDPKFRQYTYNLLTCGIDRNFLHRVTEQQLQEDCHIPTGFHRVRILTAARETLHSPITLQTTSNGTDVFISYRRSTGSQLASLLKVHLQLHGFSVFIDVEKLEAGKFEDKLIQSVLSARNFVLVLSPNALDKCMEDPECKDWVHKEIVTALNSGKNIVPVTDHFEWPDPETLPKDMRAVLKFNGIMWSHEYQEATIDKIIRFLQGRSSRDSSAGSENGLDCLHSLG